MNTVAEDVDLNHGAVSSSLLAAAGPGLQQECRAQVPAEKKLNHGQVIRTSGQKLQCQDVLHGHCDQWDAGAGNCEKVSTHACLSSILLYC